ncbi:hypothetical protein [Persephonella sp.]
MRYVVQHKKANYIRLLIILFSISVFLYLFLFTLLRFSMDYLFPSEISLYILGNPEEFLEPISLPSLLEEIHISLFINITLFITVSSILFRVKIPEVVKLTLSSLGFTFLILEPVFKLLVYFGFEFFSLFSFLSFVGFIITGFIINLINIFCFIKGHIK